MSRVSSRNAYTSTSSCVETIAHGLAYFYRHRCMNKMGAVQYSWVHHTRIYDYVIRSLGRAFFDSPSRFGTIEEHMKSKSKNMYETINKTDLYPFGRDLLDFYEVSQCVSTPFQYHLHRYEYFQQLRSTFFALDPIPNPLQHSISSTQCQITQLVFKMSFCLSHRC